MDEVRWSRRIAIVALWLAGSSLAGCGSVGSVSAVDDSQFAGDAATEVVELHAFFEGWFTGRLAATDGEFDRFRDVLAPEFQIVSPEGVMTSRTDLLIGLRDSHGFRSDRMDYRIWVENVTLRHVENGLGLVTYEECQRDEGTVSRRLSSAWFRRQDGAPNGLEWLHIHETWIDRP